MSNDPKTAATPRHAPATLESEERPIIPGFDFEDSPAMLAEARAEVPEIPGFSTAPTMTPEELDAEARHAAAEESAMWDEAEAVSAELISASIVLEDQVRTLEAENQRQAQRSSRLTQERDAALESLQSMSRRATAAQDSRDAQAMRALQISKENERLALRAANASARADQLARGAEMLVIAVRDILEGGAGPISKSQMQALRFGLEEMGAGR